MNILLIPFKLNSNLYILGRSVDVNCFKFPPWHQQIKRQPGLTKVNEESEKNDYGKKKKEKYNLFPWNMAHIVTWLRVIPVHRRRLTESNSKALEWKGA